MFCFLGCILPRFGARCDKLPRWQVCSSTANVSGEENVILASVHSGLPQCTPCGGHYANSVSQAPRTQSLVTTGTGAAVAWQTHTKPQDSQQQYATTTTTTTTTTTIAMSARCVHKVCLRISVSLRRLRCQDGRHYADVASAALYVGTRPRWRSWRSE